MGRPATPPASPAVVLAGLLLGIVDGAIAEPLVINANTSSPAPRAAWEAAIEAFEVEHPDIEVTFNVYDHESYKKSIRNWLTSASPDVVYWFVGYRMKQFVTPGLLENVSDLFTAEVKNQIPRLRSISLPSMDSNMGSRTLIITSECTTGVICWRLRAFTSPRLAGASFSRPATN